MNKIVQAVILTAIIFTGTSGWYEKTQTENFSMLVSTEWLEEHLDDSSLIILHVGRKTEYEQSHIPNARITPMPDLIESNPEGLSHEIPSLSKLESTIKALGITRNSRIVIYYASEMGIPWATRLYLTLDYVGLGSKTSLLNGGLPRWQEENRKTTTEIPKALPGNFKLVPDHSILTTRDWIKQNLRNPDIFLVDARPEEYYNGTEKEEHSLIAGHITGAINIPFVEMTYDEPVYNFKTMEELQQLFRNYGAVEKSTIVIYCGTGIWAGPVYFVAKYLGYYVKFYDAGFEEWSNEEELLVTKPVKIESVD